MGQMGLMGQIVIIILILKESLLSQKPSQKESQKKIVPKSHLSHWKAAVEPWQIPQNFANRGSAPPRASNGVGEVPFRPWGVIRPQSR